MIFFVIKKNNLTIMQKFNKFNILTTKLLLRANEKFPKLFRGNLKYVLKMLSVLRNRNSESNEKYTIASYLEDEFKWNSVNVAIKLTIFDVEKVHNWLNEYSDYFSYNGKELHKGFNSGVGYRNIGLFSFSNNQNFYKEVKMERNSSFCDYCFVSLHNHNYGNSYLNLYFKLSDKATRMIKDVNVENIEEKELITSLNPLSKQYLSHTIISKEKQIDQLIKSRFNMVINEIEQCKKDITKNLKIKSGKNSILFSEYLRECNDSYFVDKINKKKFDGKLIILPKHYNHMEIFKDKGRNIQFFLSNNYVRSSLVTEEVDAHCIKNFVQDHEDFTLLYSNNYLSIIFIIDKELKSIEKLTNAVLLNKINSLESRYLSLTEAEERLQELEEELESFKQFLKFNFRIENLEAVNEQCDVLENEIKNHKTVVEIRLKNINSKIQKENINFTKKNSKFITVLVVIQVILAIVSLEKISFDKVVSFFKIYWQLI